MSKFKPANVQFDARGVPISRDFDDPYFSFEDGLAESEYVFLEGNQLSERLRAGFQIGELGFGTGLNALLTWRLWQRIDLGGKIQFTSFEAFPMPPDARRRALGGFAALTPYLEEFEAGFDGEHFENDLISLEVILGDARDTLPLWDGQADAWFLDGFSPAKNPELWEEALMQTLFLKTKAGGSFATYSAAGSVRGALAKAGFDVTRQKGFGRKRHMSVGVKP